MILKAAALCGWFFFFGAGLYLPTAMAQSGPDDRVFRLGSFDRSSVGFADGQPKQPVDFTIGQSDPAKDWYAAQPAASISEASGQEAGNKASAPHVVHFSLEQPPATAYRLHVALLIESTSVPALRVSINGKQGTFYPHPHLDYNNGDQWDSFYPAYSHADISFAFPGSYLRKGPNTITMQAIVDAVVPGASLTYDAIELDRDAVPFRAQASSVQVLPTVFYQQKGELDELIDVYVRYGEPAKPGSSVDLTIAGKSYHQPLRGGQDFGEEKIEFTVPEFAGETHARVAWSTDGHREYSEQSINPKRKWTLFLAPHIHLDVGYSDYQAKVAAIHSHVIDEALEMTARHPDFRFSLDGSWPLDQFMKTRTAAQQQRAIAAIRDQQLFVPADYANLLTGFPAAETLIRSLYASANFSRKHGTPFNYATITDVPSYSWSYASVLASAGIQALLGGSNNYRAPVLLQGRLNEDSPIWWVGPDGKKVLLWYSRIYQQMQMLFGLPPSLKAGHSTLPLFLQQYEHPGYHAKAVILYGTQVENSDLFPEQAGLAEQWNHRYAYPRIQYSGFYDAIENIAKQFGGDIPTMRGDGGPYWEDGIAADAYYLAMERQNEDRAPSAEKLATLSSLVNPLLAVDKAGLDRMWTNMLLMDEHTWDSSDSVSNPTSMEAVKQLAIKDQYAVEAQAMADSIARNSMASLANSISAGPGNLVVFNTLNWKRSGPVSIDLKDEDEIVDRTTGKTAPVEILDSGGLRHIRFVAQDVPASGYKVYALRAAKKTPAPPETGYTTTIESPYYRVTLDPASGAVRSIYDKELQRELVDQQSPYRFGQYLYVRGGDKAPNTVLQYSRVYPAPHLQIHSAHGGSLVSVTRTPSGWVARMKSQDMNTPGIATGIRIFDHEKKIEFVEDVNKNRISSKEAVYFAFPFAMKQPEFHYEIQNGVVNPAKDMYPGAGHEWFSAQHWVSVEQAGVSGTVMPLDASLVTLGDVFRGAWPEQFGKRPAAIFSYVMNNYWDTNYAASQGGHFRFRYVVTSAPSTDAAALSRMGWEEATPLEADEVTTQDKALDQPRPLKGTQDSFLAVQDRDLLLETWKPAEDGNGTILRFLDLGGETRPVAVHTKLLNLEHAWQTNAVERGAKPLSLLGPHGFQFTIHPHEIVTVRLIGKDVLEAPAL